jgi:zinc protease
LAAEPVVRVEQLDNGLRVVVVADRTLPLVSVQTWYGVGAADDPAGQAGLCELVREVLEQRVIKLHGEAAYGAQRVTGALPGACYFAAIGLPKTVGLLIAEQLEHLRPLVLTDANVAAALVAAKRADGASGLVQCSRGWGRPVERRLLRALFGEETYGRVGQFDAAALASMTPAELQRFVERWFVPANAVLMIVGDVEAEEVLELARGPAGELPWAQPPERPWVTDAALTGRVIEPGSEPGTLVVAWATPGVRRFENRAIDVLMQRLGNRVDGVLSGRLAGMGLTVRPLWRGVWRGAGVAALEIRAADAESGAAVKLREDDAKAVEQAVVAALEEVARGVPTPLALNRARALAERAWLDRYERFGARALGWGRKEVVGGDARLLQYERGELASVGVADLQAAAALLRQGRMVLLTPADDVEAGGSTATSGPAAVAGLGVGELGDSRAAGQVVQERPQSGVELIMCPIPGLSLASVRTLVGWRGGAPEEALRRLAEEGGGEWPRATLEDYLSYRGLDLAACGGEGDAPGSIGGLASKGVGEWAPQMVELQGVLLTTLAEAGQVARGVRIVVVGDVDVAAVRAAVGESWAAFDGDEADALGNWRAGAAPRGPLEHLIGLDSAESIGAWLAGGVLNPWAWPGAAATQPASGSP